MPSRRMLGLRSLSVLALLLFFALSGSTTGPAQAAPAAADPWKITAMNVQMFRQDEGTLVDMSPDEVMSLSANAPARPLLVVVEVTGNPDPTSGYRVELTCKEGKKQVYKKVAFSNFLEKDGKFYVPFWIEGMRCDPLVITARTIGPKPASTMTKTIKFDCGE